MRRKITNWTTYTRALTHRGSVASLLDKAMLGSIPEQTGVAGHPIEYADAVILLLAQLREMFHLPLRQTIGFARSICTLAGLDLRLPGHATLARRLATVAVPSYQEYSNPLTPFIFLPDSTGLKISGEGEWKIKKHGADTHRAWVKVHLGISYRSQYIVSSLMTEPYVHDGTILPTLLDQASEHYSVAEVVADGAYGSKQLYDEAKQRGALLLVPPPRNAKWHGNLKNGQLIDEPGWEVRNSYVRGCLSVGSEEWKRQTGYHRRSLAETAMFRLKNTFGGSLRSRTRANQAAEVTLRVSLLNLFTSYGLPEYAGG